MIKLTDIIREMRVNAPKLIIAAEDTDISPEIIGYLKSIADDFDEPVDFKEWESEYGIIMNDSEDSDEIAYDDLNKEVLRRYNGKVLTFKDFFDNTRIKYMAVKNGKVLFITEDHVADDAVRSGLSIEEQIKVNIDNFLRGTSKKAKDNKINLADTEFTLYKFHFKMVETVKHTEEEENPEYRGKYWERTKDEEYYFIYPDDEVVNLSNVVSKMSLASYQRNWMNLDVGVYDESEKANVKRTRYIDIKDLEKFKDISITQATYNMLKNYTPGSTAYTIVYVISWLNIYGEYDEIISYEDKAPEQNSYYREAVELHNITT
jgi:hypothetical protein